MASNALIECPYNSTLAASLQSSDGSTITATLKSGTTEIGVYTIDKTRYSFANGKFILHATKNEETT